MQTHACSSPTRRCLCSLARTLDRTQLLIDNAREALSSPNPKTASKPEDLVRLYSSMAQVLQELIEVPILRDDLDFVKLAEARQLLYKAWRFDSGIWLTQVSVGLATDRAYPHAVPTPKEYCLA